MFDEFDTQPMSQAAPSFFEDEWDGVTTQLASTQLASMGATQLARSTSGDIFAEMASLSISAKPSTLTPKKFTFQEATQEKRETKRVSSRQSETVYSQRVGSEAVYSRGEVVYSDAMYGLMTVDINNLDGDEYLYFAHLTPQELKLVLFEPELSKLYEKTDIIPQVFQNTRISSLATDIANRFPEKISKLKCEEKWKALLVEQAQKTMEIVDEED